ncbi:MAG: biopolymer transporter ExbD, partial [candidate division Zixibacteria bacterium]|nr:biopolymer transporter ExbD [candidate division Zixibacteria bacterium]
SILVEYITKQKVVREGEEVSEAVRHYEEATPYTIPMVITHIRGTVPGAYKWFVVIKADKDVSFGTMNSIMNALQDIKISKFSLVTEMEMEREETI